MGKMCKMDQNIPRIRWSREGFATGGAKDAKNAKSCKMSRKVRNEQKWAKRAKMSKKCWNLQKLLKLAKSEKVEIWTSFTSKIAWNYYCFVKVEIPWLFFLKFPRILIFRTKIFSWNVILKEYFLCEYIFWFSFSTRFSHEISTFTKH